MVRTYARAVSASTCFGSSRSASSSDAAAAAHSRDFARITPSVWCADALEASLGRYAVISAIASSSRSSCS